MVDDGGTVAAVNLAPFLFLADLDFDQIFNLCEGVLWVSIATALIYHASRNGLPCKLAVGAAFSFALFGISDFIEIGTRAWYSPWPLLALKIACVISLLAHLYLRVRATRVEK